MNPNPLIVIRRLGWTACLCLLFFQSVSAQNLEVQEFVFDGSDVPDFITADPALRGRMSELLVQGLQSKVKCGQISFTSRDQLTYRAEHDWDFTTVLKNKVKPTKVGDTKYFASVICFFRLASIASDGLVETINLTFRTKVLVVDAKGKKVYKKSSSIPAKIDPYCGTISDSWISKRDFEQLMTTGLIDAFLRAKPRRERLALTCGRSFQLNDRLARLDSFQVRRRKKQLTALSEEGTFYNLELDMGGVDPEFSEWFFGLDLSSKLKQKGTLKDLTNQRQYELVASIHSKENRIDSTGTVAASDPAVTYFDGDRPVTQFHLTRTGSMRGIWEGDTVVVGYDYDGLINYYINNRWVALSQHFPPNKPKKEKFSSDAFFHERSLSRREREMLVHALLSFELGQVINSVALED